MKKCRKNRYCCKYEDENVIICVKEKPDTEQKIYNTLDTAEKIAVKLAQINQILKKSKKKKKIKKLGKIDKKTGTLILKKEKKQKAAKSLKKYKEKKK